VGFEEESHLRGSVKETVFWDTGVRVNDQDEFTNTDVASCPSSTFGLLESHGEGLFIDFLLVLIVPLPVKLSLVVVRWGLRSKLIHDLLDSKGKGVTEVHVGSLKLVSSFSG
jgi:hypothetical protein